MRWRNLGIIFAIVLAVAAAIATWYFRSPKTSETTIEPLGAATLAPDRCPPELRGDFEGRGSLTWESYRGRMVEMGEPLLACGPSLDDETYRFTWVHSFINRPPLSVRLSRSGSRRRLTAATYVFQKQPIRLDVTSRVERDLTEAQWKQVVDEIRRTGFWSMRGSLEAEFGHDGSVWMLEARLGRGFHLVSRWSPQFGPFRELAMRLVTLAGFEDPEPRPPYELPHNP